MRRTVPFLVLMVLTLSFFAIPKPVAADGAIDAGLVLFQWAHSSEYPDYWDASDDVEHTLEDDLRGSYFTLNKSYRYHIVYTSYEWTETVVGGVVVRMCIYDNVTTDVENIIAQSDEETQDGSGWKTISWASEDVWFENRAGIWIGVISDGYVGAVDLRASTTGPGRNYFIDFDAAYAAVGQISDNPLTETSREYSAVPGASIYHISFDGYGYYNKSTTHNQYYGNATDYIARRDTNFTFPAGTGGQYLTFVYPHTESYLNITYPTGGVYNQSMPAAELEFGDYNNTHRYVRLDNTDITNYGSYLRLFTESYDYQYTFSTPIYENGTTYPNNVIVTAHHATGNVELNVTSSGYVYGTDEEPETFSWDIGGGYARYVFVFEEETITVTIPEDTFYVYSFTIKDHTGKTGLGECFLEAYRAINGTETLIERMKIYLGNPVPLNLVYGRTYHLRVLFADGSRYNWGYFLAGGVDEINLILKAVTFTDQAQILYNHIHVEATRTATVVTVNYLDDRDNTIWANTTIRIRNGAVVLFAARNNNSYIVNWGGADADTGYMVTVTGLHTDYGTWGRSFILDPGETFPDPPSLVGIYGDVDSNFIAWVITMISLLTFSVAFRARGLVATMFIASILNYIGWASWGYNWLAFGWLIAVGVALTVGGNQ